MLKEVGLALKQARGAPRPRCLLWNGFYVPALNQPLDLNEDGKLDVAFYTTLPANRPAGVTYVNVAPTTSGGVNPQRLTNGTSGEIS
ncbi:hypothetical protein [uncultured Hymenobacter sp.]|uniref:hypothetical protein n=1 Tax=uncultured Hymenobacter sp. TaxID=170016 RepID=UPI0035CB1448